MELASAGFGSGIRPLFAIARSQPSLLANSSCPDKRISPRWSVACIAALLPCAAFGFEIDLHYHAKMAVAVADSWSWQEALVIASSDMGVDQNRETVAALEATPNEPTPHQAPKSFAFHCFSMVEDAAANERNDRADDVKRTMTGLENAANTAIDKAKASGSKADATKALIAIGVYLHCQEDSWSHSGYGNQTNSTGHTVDSAKDTALEKSGTGLANRTNPDHPAVRPVKTLMALRETLDKLSTFQQRWKGVVTDITNDDLQQLIDALTNPKTKEMLNADRVRCNRELSEHWLYLVLQRKSKLNKVPQENIRTYQASTSRFKGGPNCKDVHDAVFTGPHDERRVEEPIPKYPALDLNGMPRRVNDDGTYAEVGQRSFDLRIEKVTTTQRAITTQSCVYDITVRASNRGPDPAPLAMAAIAVIPTDFTLAMPVGSNVSLGALGALQGIEVSSSIAGPCVPEYALSVDLQPDPSVSLVESAWEDHDITNDSVVRLVPSPPPTVCDVNGDGVVDSGDIASIVASRNTIAAAGDARDADGDGMVTVDDARTCALICTQPLCNR